MREEKRRGGWRGVFGGVGGQCGKYLEEISRSGNGKYRGLARG